MIPIFLFLIAVVLLAVLFGATDLHLHRKKRSERAHRVACVGDSITNGALIPDCFRYSYPSRLQRLLGGTYHVENFGLNDRTLQFSGDKPYSNEAEYRNSLSFIPDTVVILLGTNDTRAVNWHSTERFLSEYRVLLQRYAALNSRPRLILCTPPWATDAPNRIARLTNDTVADRLPAIVDAVKAVGAEYALPVVDLYTAFKGRKDLLSYDGVHPNRKGAALIAQRVADSISDTP